MTMTIWLSKKSLFPSKITPPRRSDTFWHFHAPRNLLPNILEIWPWYDAVGRLTVAIRPPQVTVLEAMDRRGT